MLSRIWEILFQRKLVLFFALLFSAIDALTFPSIGVLLARIVVAELKFTLDPEYYQNQVNIYGIVLGALALWGASFAGLRQLLFGIIAEFTMRTLRTQSYMKILNLPVPWFDKKEHQPGTITNTVTNSCRALHGFTEKYISHVLIIITTIVVCVIGSLIFEWRTGLVSLVLIPMMIFSQAIQLAFVNGMAESKGKIYGISSQIVSESVMDIRTILSLGGTQAVDQRF
jgi:ATP-binding cassette, subfamily B, bacterial